MLSTSPDGGHIYALYTARMTTASYTPLGKSDSFRPKAYGIVEEEAAAF